MFDHLLLEAERGFFPCDVICAKSRRFNELVSNTKKCHKYLTAMLGSTVQLLRPRHINLTMTAFKYLIILPTISLLQGRYVPTINHNEESTNSYQQPDNDYQIDGTANAMMKHHAGNHQDPEDDLTEKLCHVSISQRRLTDSIMVETRTCRHPGTSPYLNGEEGECRQEWTMVILDTNDLYLLPSGCFGYIK